jgi:hypothetical protein
LHWAFNYYSLIILDFFGAIYNNKKQKKKKESIKGIINKPFNYLIEALKAKRLIFRSKRR